MPGNAKNKEQLEGSREEEGRRSLGKGGRELEMPCGSPDVA